MFFFFTVPIEVCTHLKSLKGLHHVQNHKADTRKKEKVEEANIWISLGVDETSLDVEKIP